MATARHSHPVSLNECYYLGSLCVCMCECACTCVYMCAWGGAASSAKVLSVHWMCCVTKRGAWDVSETVDRIEAGKYN